MEHWRKKILALSYTENKYSLENDLSSQNRNWKDNRHGKELHSDYDSDNSSVESMDIIMYPSASALSKTQSSKSKSEKEKSKDSNKRKLTHMPQKYFLIGEKTKSSASSKQHRKKDTFNKRDKKLSRGLSDTEKLSGEIEPKNEVQRKVVKNSHMAPNKIIKNNTIPIITKENRSPNPFQTSAISKRKSTTPKRPPLPQLTSDEKEESFSSKHKESNAAASSIFQNKMPDMSQTDKFTVRNRSEKYRSRSKKLPRKPSKIGRLSSGIEHKNEIRRKIVKISNMASKKIRNDCFISNSIKQSKSLHHFQTSSTSKEKNTVMQESNAATSRNFQDKMLDMSPNKKSTVKKRSEGYGSRNKGFLTDLIEYSNNRRISSEKRKQRPTKAKNQCNIKDKNIEKSPKIQISSENPKPQRAKCYSCIETLLEVEKEEHFTSELMHSEGGFNNTDKLGCSSNIPHFPKNQTKGNTSYLTNSNADKEMNKTEPQLCNSLQSQNKIPNESDEIITNALYNNFLNLIKIIVELDIKWLEEKKNIVEPPPKLLEGVAHLPSFFYSFDEYSHKYLSMLHLEIWEKICYSTKANMHKKINFEFSLDSYKYTYGLMQLDCKAAVHAPSENSLVIVQLKLDDGQLKSTFGFIEKLECKNNQTNERQQKLPKRQLSFKMFIKSRAVVPKIGLMKGKFICSLYKETKQAEALYYMQSSPLLKDILKPSWETFSTSFEQFHNGDFFNNQQNISDIVSKEMSVSPSKPKIMLLQGPPGSGKTRAILNIASNLLRHKQYFKKILIVAPCHVALDEIEKQLLELNDLFVDRISFVRLDKIENIQSKFLDISRRKECLMSCKDNYRSLNSFNKIDNMQQLDNEQQQMGNFLSDTSLILALPEDCWQLQKYRVKFSCCLIDEVNQGTELDLLYPFALGISKFVLVADPMQLPADVKSTKAMDCGYQRSILDRFQSYFMRYTLKNPTIVLSHQYRMHSSIAEFPFKTFYSDYQEISSSYADKRSSFYPFRPYVVIDDRCRYETKEKASGVNIIISLCSYIIDKDNTSSIGIIVPSDEEQKIYQSAIESIPELSEVEVKTVNQFQGQEKKVIILSCYHDFNKVVPFCSDYFRDKKKLNVALTRAVSSLIICGPLYELKYKYWSDIVTDSRDRRCYIRFESVVEMQNVLNIFIK